MDKKALLKVKQIVNKLNWVFTKDAYKLKAVWDLSTTPEKFVISVISETSFKIIVDFECNITDISRLDSTDTWEIHLIQKDKDSMQISTYVVNAFKKVIDK